MKEIKFNIYHFEELSAEAQKRAIEEYRENYFSFAWQDEIINSIEEIADCVNCKSSWYSYDGINYCVTLEPTDNYRGGDDSDVMYLEGRRAWAFIENNYIYYAEKAKTYYLKNKKRKSKINFRIDNCPFTGYIADCCFNEAWEEWKKNFRPATKEFYGSTVADFIHILEDKLSEEWSADNNYQYSEEGIKEILEINDYYFTEEGKFYFE